MAVINKKNILNLGIAQRRQWWDQIRDKPELQLKLTAAELVGMIPGGSGVGKLVASFLRFSIKIEGVVEFLIGDDPTPRGS